MAKLACTLLIALLASACAKGGKSASLVEAAGPTDCIDLGSVTYDFRGYAALSARKYLCNVPEAPSMTCYYYVSDVTTELACHAESSSSAVPAGCDGSIYSGTRFFYTQDRTFASTSMLTSDSFICPSAYGLMCSFHRHSPDGTDSSPYQDLQCTEY